MSQRHVYALACISSMNRGHEARTFRAKGNYTTIHYRPFQSRFLRDKKEKKRRSRVNFRPVRFRKQTRWSSRDRLIFYAEFQFRAPFRRRRVYKSTSTEEKQNRKIGQRFCSYDYWSHLPRHCPKYRGKHCEFPASAVHPLIHVLKFAIWASGNFGQKFRPKLIIYPSHPRTCLIRVPLCRNVFAGDLIAS